MISVSPTLSLGDSLAQGAKTPYPTPLSTEEVSYLTLKAGGPFV